MKKKTLILFAAEFLIDKYSQTSTLDIKEFCRKNFKGTWKQHYVSDVMRNSDYPWDNRDSGNYRTYLQKDVQPINSNIDPNIHTIKTPYGELTGTLSEIGAYVTDNKLLFRYSESKNSFEDITTYAFPHLENVINKDMDGMNKKERKAYFKSPIYIYYMKQYSALNN